MLFKNDVCSSFFQGYGRELYFTNRNYTTEFPRTTDITANLSLSTNSTMALNDKPAMEDVLWNKHVRSNHTITDTTKKSVDSTIIVGIVIPVALVIFAIVIIVLLCVCKSRRGSATDVNTSGQNIGLMEHNP